MSAEPSILKSTKVMLNVAPDDDSFDAQIIGYLNGVLSDLLDLGIGPTDGISVEDEEAAWSALIPSSDQMGRIKNLVFLKVRSLWDPPQTGFLKDALNEQIKEAEWRIVNRLDGDRYDADHVVVEIT